jgi:hypothetical protein
MAPSVLRRADLHVARYHKPSEEDGRGWITWDGDEIVSFDTWPYLLSQRNLAQGLIELGEDTWDAWRRSERIAKANGLFHVDEFMDAIETYPTLPFKTAIASDNPIIRSLSMLDRRLGKRRLRAMEISEHEFGYIRRLHELRCEAEGIARTAG